MKKVPDVISLGDMITYRSRHLKDVAIVTEVRKQYIGLYWSGSGVQLIMIDNLRALLTNPGYRYYKAREQ
jgi:hypothetical protein